jgi:hypothetical protein
MSIYYISFRLGGVYSCLLSLIIVGLKKLTSVEFIGLGIVLAVWLKMFVRVLFILVLLITVEPICFYCCF